MTTTIYATVDQFAVWIDGDLPANARALLRTASMAVRERTETAWYAVDPVTGLPSVDTVTQAFADATCSQAAAMLTLGIDPLAGGASGPAVESEVAIGSARVVYADAATAVLARRIVEGGLCPEAERILRQALIYMDAPWVVG